MLLGGLIRMIIQVSLEPIVKNIDPTITDLADIGRIWVNKTTRKAWILIGEKNGESDWLLITKE